MARRVEDPYDYKGPRTVVRTKSTICGWCLSNDCENCKPELVWYEKLYVCGCKCKDDYVPQNTNGTMEPETEKKRGKDEVRTMRVSNEAGQHAEVDDSPGDLPADGPGQDEGSLEEQRVDGDVHEEQE